MNWNKNIKSREQIMLYWPRRYNQREKTYNATTKYQSIKLDNFRTIISVK